MPSRPRTLNAIVASGLCTGCGACVAVLPPGRVAMRLDAAGWLRPQPVQPLSPTEDRAVCEVCPGIGLRHDAKDRAHYHPIWGPLRQVAAGHATDARVRHRASSGGVLSALLIHLLQTRQIDYVVQVRASADDPLRNDAVLSTTPREVMDAAGSRYAPAAPLVALPEALARCGRFAFVGKPCDAAALRKMMARDALLAGRVAAVLSFMCAGTPSIAGSHEVLARMGMSLEGVKSFRYRGEGWPGRTSAETAEGRVASMDYETAWGTILNRYLQTRCKLCGDGTGEFADIAGADAWYSSDGKPDLQEREGRSLLLVRTTRGEELLRDTAGALSLEPFDLEAMRTIQPYQYDRKTLLPMRLLAIILTGKFAPKYRGFRMNTSVIRRSPLRLLREFSGTLVRSIRGKL